MICRVNGKYIESQRIGPPAMNYGQKRNFGGRNTSNYEYVFTLDEFQAITQKWFEDFSLEAIEDAENDIPGEFPIYDKMRALKYPKFEEILLNHKELLSDIILFCDLDILNLVNSNSRNNEIQMSYLIHSVEWVKVDKEISFGGLAINKT